MKRNSKYMRIKVKQIRIKNGRKNRIDKDE